MGMKWYLIVDLVYSFLMISNFKHLLRYLLVIYIYVFFGEMSIKVLYSF